ncbi:uncharacterized protein METZ01_LOCUS326485, partial [marine metagenome]
MGSNAMQNLKGIDYSLSALFLNLRYRNIEVGSSWHILSGGYNEFNWDLRDATKVLITKNNLKYWD